MINFLIITAFLLFLYVIKKQLIELTRFICDNFLKILSEMLGHWIEPLSNKMKEGRPTIPLGRLMGSIFLFGVTLLLCILNYYLIFYGMELLLPSEEKLKTFGFTPAGLGSIVIMLAEVALGFLILEALGITDLFNWHRTMKKSTKIGLIIFFLLVFSFLLTAEIGIALKRIYEVTDNTEIPKSGAEKFLHTLPYGVTAIITGSVPVLNAISAFSLRDILLLILWLVLTTLHILLFLMNVSYKIIFNIITRLDDIFGLILKVLTWPVELIMSGIIYFLIKIKLVRPAVPILIFLLILPSTVLPQTHISSDKIILVLMDNSGSFKSYINRALNHCVKYIDAMEPGNKFALFLIDVDSLKRDIPPIKCELAKQATTLLTRKDRAKIKAEKDKAKMEILKISEKPRARLTDIAGAISRASTFLNSSLYSGYEKHLLIYSDMQDTRGRDTVGKASLEGVCIKIFFVDITEKTIAGIESWVKKLQDLGARNITILTPDECELQTNFSLKCEEVKK